MKSLSENQRKILEFLLDRHDGATLEELASHLEITKTAVKEHILRIEGLGYLTYRDTKGLVGRPKRRYLLTSEGHEVFPRQYAWLSNVLLQQLLEDCGQQGTIKVMRTLGTKVASSMESRFRQTGSTPKLLTEITKALNELGYRVALKQSDLRKGAVLEATNCVYHSVAQKHPELCEFDTQFIKQASGLDVTLETCIAKGGSTCRFCLRKKS